MTRITDVSSLKPGDRICTIITHNYSRLNGYGYIPTHQMILSKNVHHITDKKHNVVLEYSKTSTTHTKNDIVKSWFYYDDEAIRQQTVAYKYHKFINAVNAAIKLIRMDKHDELMQGFLKYTDEEIDTFVAEVNTVINRCEALLE